MTKLISSLFLSTVVLAEGAQRFLEEHQRSRVFLRYRGLRGRRAARKCAKNILRDDDGDDVMILDANSTCVQKLLRSADIKEADYDNEVAGLGLTDNEWVSSYARALEEVTPWGIEQIQADQLPTTTNEITVCIVDSGLAAGHPDFISENINGTDSVKFWGDPWAWNKDGSGHGTHVAGIIAASAGNGVGVSGVGQSNIKVHITRALGDDGRGYESDIRDAVEQCVETGAKVINLSLGGPYMSGRSSQFYTRFVQEYGVIMVAAAGNDGNQAPVYPAGHPDVISVSASNDSGMRWTGSSYGSQTELSAPGHNVLSTYASNAAVSNEDTEMSYTASFVNGSPKSHATGALRLCDESDDKCRSTDDGDICMYRKTTSAQVSDLIEMCVEGGGAGLILFTASTQPISTWSSPSDIPVVAVTKNIADLILHWEGDEVTIGDEGADDVEYSYEYLTGTSMAAPHVSAGAAMVWALHPECDNHQIRYALAANAQHPDGSNYCDDHMGYGVIKLMDTHEWLLDNPCSDWAVSLISTGGCSTLHTD